MKTDNISKVLFIILIFSVLLSCDKKRHKSKDILNVTNSDFVKKDAIPNEFKSALRPNEIVVFGKTYKDTVQFINVDDNGDDWLFIVRNTKDTISLIMNNDENFIRGDKLEINWKIDSIRYAGDESFLDFTEYLISAKKLKSLKLTDKNIRFLWRNIQYDEELQIDVSTIILNENYIKTISDPEKAAIAYVATFIGNGCEWDGKANEYRSNLKCKILWSLDLGYQCSNNHLGFLEYWFRNDKTILKALENCPTIPDGATVQDTFDEISIETNGNQITVFFKANGINMREAKSWSWTEKHSFEFRNNELILIEKDVSPIKQSTFEVRGN